MIKTVIFDIGGVIKKTNFKAIYSGFAERIGISPEIVNNYHKEKMADILLGNISLEQFWQDMKNAGGKTGFSYEREWLEEASKNTEVNYELLSLVKKIREKYKVGVLSNVSYSRLCIDNSLDLYSNFDYAVLSCVEHLIKPDPAFYQLAIKKADSLPSEAVFIDDKKEFTDMAEKMGIKSILYLGNNERLLNEFKELGICEE